MQQLAVRPTTRAVALAAVALAAAALSPIAPGASASGLYAQIICADPDTGTVMGPDAIDGLSAAGTATDWRPRFGGGVCAGTSMSAQNAIALTPRQGGTFDGGAWAALRYELNKPHLTLSFGNILRGVRGEGIDHSFVDAGQHAGSDWANPWSAPANPWDPANHSSSSYDRGDPDNPVAAGNDLPLAVRANQWTITARCAGHFDTGKCSQTAGEWRYVVFGGRMYISDDAPPTATSVTGDMADGAPVGADLRLSATDEGAGLYRYELLLDDSVIQSGPLAPASPTCRDALPFSGTRYEFTRQVPCPASVETTISWEPQDYSEGDHRLKLRIEDAGGNVGYALDRRVRIDEVPDPKHLADAPPQISGALEEGRQLAGAPGGWADTASYAYQWQQCSADLSRCLDIPYATGSTYVADDDDVGRRLRLLVTGRNRAGETASARSEPTPTIAARDAGGGPATPPPGGGGQTGSGQAQGPGPAAGGGSAGTAGGTTTTGPASDRPNGRGASRNARLSVSVGSGRTRSQPLRFTSTPRLGGRLLDETGRPIAGAVLDVTARPRAAGASPTRLRDATTTDDGRFSLQLPPGPSRTVMVAYRAQLADARPDVTAAVALTVSARVTLQARAARPGQLTRLSGRLVHAPQRGVQIEVQALDGRRWRTFDTTTTDSRGQFSYGYRFKPTAAGRTFYLRVLVRSPVYPFAPGASRAVRVRVPG